MPSAPLYRRFANESQVLVNRPKIRVELNPWCEESQRYCLTMAHSPETQSASTYATANTVYIHHSNHGTPEAAELAARRLAPKGSLTFTYDYQFSYDVRNPEHVAYFRRWDRQLRPTIEAQLPQGALTVRMYHHPIDGLTNEFLHVPNLQRVDRRDRSGWSPLDSIEEDGYKIRVVRDAKIRHPEPLAPPPDVSGSWHWVAPFTDTPLGVAYRVPAGSSQRVELLMNPSRPLAGPVRIPPLDALTSAHTTWLTEHQVTLDAPSVEPVILEQVRDQYWKIQDRLAWQKEALERRSTVLEYAGDDADRDPHSPTWYASEVTTPTGQTTWVLWKGVETHDADLGNADSMFYVKSLVTNQTGVPTFASVADADAYARVAGAVCELASHPQVQALFDQQLPERIKATRPPGPWQILPVGEREAVLGRYHPSHDRWELLTRRDRPPETRNPVQPAPADQPDDPEAVWQLQAINAQEAVAVRFPFVMNPDNPEEWSLGDPIILRNPRDPDQAPLRLPIDVANDPERLAQWDPDAVTLPEGFTWQAGTSVSPSTPRKISGTLVGPAASVNDLTPDIVEAIQAEYARVESRHPWNSPWTFPRALKDSELFPALCAERGFSDVPAWVPAAQLPPHQVQALERAYRDPSAPLALPADLPTPPPPGLDDAQDPRWRVIRPTAADQWWLVRPQSTPQGVQLTTVYTDARQTQPKTFTTAELQSEDFEQWVGKHHLALHPERVDDPKRLPAHWPKQLQALMQAARVKIASRPVESTVDDPRDSRWRLVRPTPAERWMLVRPRSGPKGIRLETVYSNPSTQTPQAFSATESQPAAIAAWAHQHDLVLHPERLDNPQKIPLAWKSEFVRLFKLVGTPLPGVNRSLSAPGPSPKSPVSPTL